MIGEHFPKVSPPSRQSLKSYNAKFVMDKCARKKYGATLTKENIKKVTNATVSVTIMSPAQYNLWINNWYTFPNITYITYCSSVPDLSLVSYSSSVVIV